MQLIYDISSESPQFLAKMETTAFNQMDFCQLMHLLNLQFNSYPDSHACSAHTWPILGC